VIAFLAYCLHVTLGHRPKYLAPGLSTRSVLEKFSAVQMIDVRIPTSDGREFDLTRYTHPRAGSEAAARSPQARPPGPATAKNHRRPGREGVPDFVCEA
jgi:hypothetical protein